MATAKKKAKRSRDIEKGYTNAAFVAKLRRLADSIEGGKRFAIQVAGERIQVPANAIFNIEHERSSDDEEIEFQIKWKRE
jgi:amphi-Trp domain-containing protein